MDKLNFDDLLKRINFDEHYLEATFQFKLLMQLGKIYDEDKILPERHIKAYGLKAENYTKKEIDIVIGQENNLNIAIELKMPMNGQVPEQMYKFIEDIKFLEELSVSNHFHKCYLIVVTNDKDFWEGNKNDGIYSYFRNNNILTGKVYKPTGKAEIKAANCYELSGEYEIQWNSLVKNFKYFVIEIECLATEQDYMAEDTGHLDEVDVKQKETIIKNNTFTSDIGNLWKRIVLELTQPIDIQTIARGFWFSACSRDGKILINKSKKEKSSDLTEERKIDEKTFSKVYDGYYKRCISTKDRSKLSKDNSYILALINHFEEKSTPKTS